MTPFGARIRQLRQDKGLTLSRMAEDLGVTPAYLSALEHGRRGRPAPGLIMQMCGVLNLIWDEAAELKELAKISHPKVTLDTSGLTPLATEFANRLQSAIRDLDDETIASMLAHLPERK
ncbi:MAG: helix-turn-helix transcriptional regulator [Alphaproteobacteria bacterium]|nr:helix-turn-helix transcriptional regulator [Alphaproteobacteria bacterium]